MKRGFAMLLGIAAVTLLPACVAGGGGYYGGGGGVDVTYGADFYEPWGYEYGGWGPRYWVGPPAAEIMDMDGLHGRTSARISSGCAVALHAFDSLAPFALQTLSSAQSLRARWPALLEHWRRAQRPPRPLRPRRLSVRYRERACPCTFGERLIERRSESDEALLERFQCAAFDYFLKHCNPANGSHRRYEPRRRTRKHRRGRLCAVVLSGGRGTRLDGARRGGVANACDAAVFLEQRAKRSAAMRPATEASTTTSSTCKAAAACGSRNCR
jgi:hypothetical protein